MMIPDSLQTIGFHIFRGCSKLVPSNIDVNDPAIDSTPEVVGYLRSEIFLNALLSGNNFLGTDDFRRLLIQFVPDDMLMTMRMISKLWLRVADEFIGDDVESGAMIVRGEEDLPGGSFYDIKKRHEHVTRVIFLLNIKKVGDGACYYAINLVVVDIPEGIVSIGDRDFFGCTSLTTVSFPTTLKSIGYRAFAYCTSLETIDLLRTNLQELGDRTFYGRSELNSMTILDSLQTLGRYVFHNCPKLVPYNVNVYDDDAVVAHLRSQQQQQEYILELKSNF